MVEEYDAYIRFLKIQALDAVSLARAREIFREYQNRNTIIEGAFQDSVWTISDEVHTLHLNFYIDAEEYQKGAGSWSCCGCDDFVTCMKVFVIFHLGNRVLSGLYETLRGLKRLARSDMETVLALNNTCMELDFLSLLPSESDELDLVMETLEENHSMASWKHHFPRQLGDFRDYLRFDKTLRDYWSHAKSVEKRIYFPIYFWWNLTAVLPLRPTEFLLTPADCLEKRDGKYLLSVRRTAMKKRKRSVTYRIESDYEVNRYEIPEKLGREIESYQAQRIGPPGGMTLFPRNRYGEGHMSYTQLRSLLGKFLAEVFPDDTVSVRLGDTRHLAMINLMLSGGSPTICKALAGHDDINISANYYANLSSIIESVVYEHARSSGQETALDGRMYFPLTVPKESIRIKDGWCDYTPVREGDIQECLKNWRGSDILGDCLNCPHFYPDKSGLRLRIMRDRKSAVDESSAFLIQMIEQARQGLQLPESIAAAMARLQDDSRRYAGILYRKLEMEGNHGSP